MAASVSRPLNSPIVTSPGAAPAGGREEAVLRANAQLLQAIAVGDWEMYTRLTSPTLTAFEPEARGALVEGLQFHRFYFRLTAARTGAAGAAAAPPLFPLNSISSPQVRLLPGERAAVVAYVRLQQGCDSAGQATTLATEETRVWELREGSDDEWVNVHFHRSVGSK